MMKIVRSRYLDDLKAEIRRLEAEVERLNQTELELRELIDKIAQQNPEAQRIIGNQKIIGEERQDKSNSESAQDAPNGLPTILHPDLRIQYSVRFEKSFFSLTEAEKGSAERSVRFLAENGIDHLGFRSVPLRRKMH